MRTLFESWGLRGERTAKAKLSALGRGKGSWLDMAQTRKSITHATTPRTGMPREGRMGSNLMTARWGDMGTGLVSEDPDSPKRRHWPPSYALERFVAKKHPVGRDGEPMTAYQVARAIGLRGGLMPRRFIRDGARDANSQMPVYLRALATNIEQAARRGT